MEFSGGNSSGVRRKGSGSRVGSQELRWWLCAGDGDHGEENDCELKIPRIMLISCKKEWLSKLSTYNLEHFEYGFVGWFATGLKAISELIPFGSHGSVFISNSATFLGPAPHFTSFNWWALRGLQKKNSDQPLRNHDTLHVINASTLVFRSSKYCIVRVPCVSTLRWCQHQTKSCRIAMDVGVVLCITNSQINAHHSSIRTSYQPHSEYCLH